MRVLTMKQQASARSYCVPEMQRKCMGRKSLPEGMIGNPFGQAFIFTDSSRMQNR